MTDMPSSPAAWPAQPALQSLQQVLRQLRIVVEKLDDQQYARKPVGVFDSSIGGHTRHCLDHAAALASAAQTGELNYDRRERQTLIEHDRAAALNEFDRVTAALDSMADLDPHRTIQLTCTICADGTEIRVPSSLGREIAFVLSHTVHHNALVAGMARTLGQSVACDFGFAPSTLAFLSGRSCAQ